MNINLKINIKSIFIFIFIIFIMNIIIKAPSRNKKWVIWKNRLFHLDVGTEGSVIV
jgi:hypothetical protein